MERHIPASLSGLAAGETTVRAFADTTGLNERQAAHAMEWWHDMGIGSANGDVHTYAPGERLEAAVSLLEAGVNLDEVAPRLHWRDFEGLAARILEGEGYAVTRNHIMTKPRMEIDVVGARMDVAILADCKHWRRSSGLAKAAARQLVRARRWSNENRTVSIPVIVTLLEGAQPAGMVPAVPVSRFRSFAAEIFGNLEGLAVTPEP